ncbi:arsenite methyltransferase [Paraburkholderia sp. GAS333]|uniref:class I SAM-dependent methyltransferase n=1 Tax=Paraburkholderia sp. GAS333 TaxID=3156279 RepID=UPI003D249908
MNIPQHANPDLWRQWLLCDRFAADHEHERQLRAEVARIADRVLDAAKLAPGTTLVDVGTGDGLLAFRAIARIGATLGVYLADVSPLLLEHCHSVATERNIADQCTFLQCSADDLKEIPDATVDAVTTRAVIAYLPDKAKVLREFHRILKPGGRISIAEPIRRDEAFETLALRKFIDAGPAVSDDRFFRLLHRWKATQLPDTEEDIAANPMTNFNERDLVRHALDSGFADIHMEFHIDVVRSLIRSWDLLLKSTPFPWAPPLGTFLEQACSDDDRMLFEKIFRPRVDSGQLFGPERTAYLSAIKPGK